MPDTARRGPLIAAGMAVGLLLFYLSPVPFVIRLHGLLLFGALALLRPDLALAFVPAAAPLYLIPAALGGLRERETLLPLHEVALGLTAGAAALRWAAGRVWPERSGALAPWGGALAWGPALLFLAAGAWGALIALPGSRAEALRELRWMVVEPIVFFALLRSVPRAPRAAAAGLVAAGAAVALLGLLQAAGLDLVPLLGRKQSFSENLVEAGSVVRVASVYGHPNNLGLFLGRAWPLAAALALAAWRPGDGGAPRRLAAAAWGAAALLCLGGLAVSYSRGAWLGAGAAALVLVLVRSRRRAAWPLAALAVLAAAGALLAVSLRGGGGSEGARLLLWREAAGYIAQHPLGIGLDQFYAYHRPDSGRSLIDPSLVGTSEEYAAHPHNLLLDAWLRTGPLGVAALAWGLARAARGAARGLAQPGPEGALAAGVLAALAAAVAHGMVDQFYFVPDLAIAFWLLVALGERGRAAEALRDSGPRAALAGVRNPLG